MGRNLTFLAGLAVVAFGGWFLLNQTNSEPLDPIGAAFAQDAADVDTSMIKEMSLGNPDADVTVIEYASFTCPHCASFHAEIYPQLKENFIDTGKVKFVFREVYFDRFGLWAGMLARCGGNQRYFGIVDLLFKKQSEWTRGSQDENVAGMYSIGRQAGLTDDQMGACLQDQAQAEALVADYQLKAGEDGVRATPSFVINGELMSNMSYADFEQVINDRLN